MKHNPYHELVESIKAPPALKEHTRLLLQKEIGRQRRARRLRVAVTALSAVAAALLITVGLRTALGPASPIVTQLTAGEHAAAVELRDGELLFQPVDEGMDRPIQLAPPYPIRQAWSLESYREAYPDSPLSAALPRGYAAVESSVTAYYQKPSPQPAAALAKVVLTKGEGRVTVAAASDARIISAPVPAQGSVIAGTEVGAGYDAATGCYYAVLQRGGQTLTLTGEGVDQEEFVLLLHHFATV